MSSELTAATKKPKPRRARGALAPMRVSDGFRDFALDQLAGVAGLRPRSMFGGVGLYADDVFFGILAADVLYFKVDDRTRSEYEAAGASPFRPYQGRAMTMSYYSVPIHILEDAAAVREWSLRAVAAASAAKAAKTKPAARRVVRRPGTGRERGRSSRSRGNR